MSTKVKGIFKGFKYISQIFDEKEDEIQIGFPTDVKHVAHIGSDDPSANAPSWMNEYKEPTQGTENATEKLEEHNNNNSSSKGSKIRHLIPKSRHQSIDNNDSNDHTKHKHTRRHRSTDASSESTSVHDSSSGSSRHSRRHRRGSNHGSESPLPDGMPPTATKPRRKSKMASSEDGDSVRKPSTRTSRRSSKGDSITDISLTELESGEPGLHGSK
ncbi:PREDICTED: CRIB domain-containing protein RIC10-like isoform X3 [Lupinus angustifolius]|uniref:CRIB domain-containing protein RIC10-like isoform X3 n=1 Tax=Lupinus angustifolius TaxID=3871 RepID=UPI00092E81D1|nr:PREDICTED: CRIB domain-containing protein RIC10-like isoform X3 [Lupinus angustifolius]